MYELQDLADALELGDKTRVVCPQCDGGSTVETCMTLEHTEAGVLYCCHRASCGVSGLMKDNWNFSGEQGSNISLKLLEDTQPHQIPSDLKEIPKRIRRYMQFSYGLDAGTLEKFRIGWCSKGLYIPVENGYITRSLSVPKRVQNFGRNLCWHSLSDNIGPVFLVEDVLSGMRLSQAGYSVIALLGTNLSPPAIEQFLEWQEMGYVESALIGLDNDATPVAFKIAEELREYTYLEVHVLRLLKDIKDMRDEEFEDFIALTEEL